MLIFLLCGIVNVFRLFLLAPGYVLSAPGYILVAPGYVVDIALRHLSTLLIALSSPLEIALFYLIR